MKILEGFVGKIKDLKDDHRGVLFYVAALGTVAYLAMLYFRFFASPGMPIQPEGKNLYLALLGAYTTATQAERARGSACGYKQRPGEWLTACWIFSAFFFWFVPPIFHVGDTTILHEIVGAGPEYPIDWILGLWGINYAFRTQLVQKVGQALASVPTANGKNGGTTPPPSPSS